MIVVAAVAVGVVAGGDMGVVVGLGGLLWATSAESFVRRSAALRGGRVTSVVRAELIGAAVLAVGLGAAVVAEQHAVWIFGVALVAKQFVEVGVVRGLARAVRRGRPGAGHALSSGGPRSWPTPSPTWTT